MQENKHRKKIRTVLRENFAISERLRLILFPNNYNNQNYEERQEIQSSEPKSDCTQS